ncbi:ParB/RepB/Spo0J family partition protein [Candidatus Saccharibacteria bacterium]|nr:ParB/RepB/Spo0J family partition protein [Candidatus Saccharibacteria bacterium]
MVKKGLGKGFDALIPDDLVNSEFDTTAVEDEKVSDLRVLAIADISPNVDQPRRNFDDEQLEQLAESIREHGILQPIVVTPTRKGFEIVAGERRWRAASLAGVKKTPAIVRTLSAQHKLELSIIENVQRADLSPLETATAYLKLKNQFNLIDAEIAKRVGKAPSTISNQMRLLTLPDFARESLTTGQISEGHARQILALPNVKVQKQLLDEIIKNNWSVRKAEQFVIGYKKQAKGLDPEAREKTARNATLEETNVTRKIAKKIGLKPENVQQKTTAHGGQIIIKFSDEAELKQINDIFSK